MPALEGKHHSAAAAVLMSVLLLSDDPDPTQSDRITQPQQDILCTIDNYRYIVSPEVK